MLGDLLYQPTARDLTGLPLTAFSHVVASSWTTTTLNVYSNDPETTHTPFTVPSDKILVLQSLSLWSIAGNGQNTISQQVHILPDNAALHADHHPLLLGWTGSQQIVIQQITIPLYIPPGWRFAIIANYSSAVNANTVRLGMYGYTVPVGNFARR